MYRVRYQAKAVKQLQKIPEQDFIRKKCRELRNFPDCSQVKALKNYPYPYRLRVGRYRVFFNVVNGEVNIILIEEVKKRDERTY